MVHARVLEYVREGRPVWKGSRDFGEAPKFEAVAMAFAWMYSKVDPIRVRAPPSESLDKPVPDHMLTPGFSACMCPWIPEEG